MKFSRQEYWSGLPCPPPGDLPKPGTEPASLRSPALAGGSLPLVPPGKPQLNLHTCLFKYISLHLYYGLPSGYPEEGNGNQLQYSCLENSTDGGA